MRLVVIYETENYRRLAFKLAKKFDTTERDCEIYVMNLLPSSQKKFKSRFEYYFRKFNLYVFDFFLNLGKKILRKSDDNARLFSLCNRIIVFPNNIFEYQFDKIILLGETSNALNLINRHFKNVLEFRFANSHPGLIEIVYKQDYIEMIVNSWAGINLTRTQTYLLPTQSTLSRNQLMILGRIEQIMGYTLDQGPRLFRQNRESPLVGPHFSDLRQIRKVDRVNIVIKAKYICFIMSELISDLASKLFSSPERIWQIALSRSTIESLTVGKYEYIPNPFDGYFADPFLLDFDGEKFIFCEEFNFKQKKGEISAIQLNKESYQIHHRIIEEPFHLSYPFPFKFKNRQYLCPESGASGELRIYESLNSPFHWELISRWFPDRPLYDPQIFENENVWWLLATVGKKELNDFYSELVLYWSDNPISGTWEAHPLNPICIDSMRGRNAGFICRQNRNYRVGQRYGFRNYGAGFSIFEINEISKVSYSESLLLRSEEIFVSHITQSHHINENFGMTVFDFKDFYQVTRKT